MSTVQDRKNEAKKAIKNRQSNVRFIPATRLNRARYNVLIDNYIVMFTEINGRILYDGERENGIKPVFDKAEKV